MMLACAAMSMLVSAELARPLARASGAPSLDDVVAAMTLEEKVAMLAGATDPSSSSGAGYLPGVARLGVPPLRVSDGPSGVATVQPATALPAPIALGATFDPALARRYGQVIGGEGRARHQDVLLAPRVNIARVPRAGRNFETLGEDPLLTGRLAGAEITGIQVAGVIAAVKDFAGHQENQRVAIDVSVDEQTLWEIELPAFEAAIRAGAGAVMAASNTVNGSYASEHPTLLSDILRREWAFDGFVMSDWDATHSDIAALTAGLDVEMPSGRYFPSLLGAVNAHEIDVKILDRAVRRVLVQMQRVGMLDAKARPPALDEAAGARVALDVALAGAVLLRNEKNRCRWALTILLRWPSSGRRRERRSSAAAAAQASDPSTLPPARSAP